MIKKVLMMVLLTGLLLTSTGVADIPAASAVTADDGYVTSKDGRFRYEVFESEEENYVHIYRYLGDETSLIIPDTMDGYVVRGLLVNLLYQNTTVEEIEIPNTLAYIEAGVFSAAYALKSIHMEDGFAEAFHTEDGILYNGGCMISYPAGREDTTFVIPNGVGSIQMDAFYGCVNLEKVVVPSNTEFLLNPFCRCKKPLDIVIKNDVYEKYYLKDACWQMLEGTRFLVANEELAQQYMAEMTNNNYYAYTYNDKQYFEIDKPMAVEVYEEVPSTDLTFADGTRSKDITVLYNPDKKTVYTNLYTDGEVVETKGFDFTDDFIQYPSDCTENVLFDVTGDAIVDHPAGGAFMTIKSGGTFTVTGYDESGHEITANVTVYYPMEKFNLNSEVVTLYADDVEAERITKINGVLNKNISYAYAKGVTWTAEDSSIMQIVSDGKEKTSTSGRIWCEVQGLSAGKTTLTATVSDNGTPVTESVEVYVKDTIDNCTIESIPAQAYTGTQLTPVPLVTYNGRTLTEGIDYEVSYGDNLFLSGSVTITGKGVFYGTKELTFDITDTMENCTVRSISTQKKSDIQGGKYPDVSITYNGTNLVKDTDYTVTYSIAEDYSAGSVTITGMGRFTGEKTVDFTIVDTDTMDYCTITPIPKQKKSDILNGVYPDVSITHDGKELEKDVHYTLAYTIAEDYTSGSVTITGTGRYSGTKTVNFTIYIDEAACTDISVNAAATMEASYPKVKGIQNVNNLISGIYTTGADILKTLRITCDGKELALNTDYSITLRKQGIIPSKYNMETKTMFDSGDYELTITGIQKAGYTGSLVLTFTVYDNYEELLNEYLNGGSGSAGNGGNSQNGSNGGNGNSGNNGSNNTGNENTASIQTVTKTTAIGSKAFNASKVVTISGKASYKTSNKSVATVNKKGKITLKKAGYTEITVTDTKGKKVIKLYVAPKKAKLTYVLSTKKKTVTVKWKKDKTVSGYEVEYSLKKNFKNSTKVNISKSKKTSTKLTGLKSKKKYYIRVKSYITIDGVKYYGAGSNKKTAKIR